MPWIVSMGEDKERSRRGRIQKRSFGTGGKLVTIIMVSYHTIAIGCFSPSFEPLGVRTMQKWLKKEGEKFPVCMVW